MEKSRSRAGLLILAVLLAASALFFFLRGGEKDESLEGRLSQLASWSPTTRGRDAR